MSKNTSARRRKRKLIFLVIEIILIVILAIGLLVFNKLNLIKRVSFDQSAMKTNKLSEETVKKYTGYTTIALFGLDNRKQGDYRTGNTDVIMIANINNDTKEMKIVSVYRDTFLNVGDEDITFQKCNSAYARGGYKRAISMLNKNLDIEVDNYLAFDFQAVADAVDILGGVTINIDSEEELKYLNKYIKHTNGILDTHAKTFKTVGKHNLNGVQAVAYARIRYTAGGDYKRAQRQRLVLSKMIAKARKANFSQMNKLVNAVFPKIETGLSQKEMLNMMRAMLNYDSSNSRGFPFTRTTKTLPAKGSVVVPCDLESNVIKLQKYFYGTDNYKPSDAVKKYSQMIVSQTGITKNGAAHDSFEGGDNFKNSSTNTTGSSGSSSGTGSTSN